MEKFANLRRRRFKQDVTVRSDANAPEYFRDRGKGGQTAMNDALGTFMETGQAQQ